MAKRRRKQGIGRTTTRELRLALQWLKGCQTNLRYSRNLHQHPVDRAFRIERLQRQLGALERELVEIHNHAVREQRAQPSKRRAA